MKAVTYEGFRDVKVKEVPDPALEHEEDIIVRISHSSICGSDIHLYHGAISSLEKGYIIGHEAVGVVEETGSGVSRLKKGDQIVIPFTIGCGACFYCQNEMESQCDNSNPEGETGAYFGCSRLYGDYDGCQAEYVRVPFANFTSFKVPRDNEVEPEKLLLLADALPTSYWSVLNGGVKPGDTVIVLGCGPIGLLTQKFAWLCGAERVIAVDAVPYRLEHAIRKNRVEAFNLNAYGDLSGILKETTKGGADVVIDCVGMDGKMTLLEMAESALQIQGGAMGAIIMASQAVRKGGTIQLTGVYGLRYNQFPLGDLFARNITLKMGQAPVIHLMASLYGMIKAGKIDPLDIITHQLPLGKAEEAYRLFEKKKDGCIKVVLRS